MLTALLSASRHTETGDLRAAQMIGGRSVLAWQATTALAIGCKRIVCLCDTPDTTILSLQREVEALGGEFHAVRNSLQLVALARPDDTIVMFADGLLIAPDMGRELLVSHDDKVRHAVFTFPDKSKYPISAPEDFERIDAARHWAGLLSMPASAVEPLADFPPDGDVISLALRLALQARVEMVGMPLSDMPSEKWVLIADARTAQAHERALIAWASASISSAGPSLALATSIPAWFAPKGLFHGAMTSTILGLLLLLGALVGSVFGYGPTALLLLASSVFFGNLGLAWHNLSNDLLGRVSKSHILQYFNCLIDIPAVCCLALVLQSTSVILLSLPLFIVGLSRLAAGNSPPSIAPFWNDRALHLAVFAVCAVYGLLGEALAVFGLLALLQVIVDHQRMSGANSTDAE